MLLGVPAYEGLTMSAELSPTLPTSGQLGSRFAHGNPIS